MHRNKAVQSAGRCRAAEGHARLMLTILGTPAPSVLHYPTCGRRNGSDNLWLGHT
jgi:hypothetical protein